MAQIPLVQDTDAEALADACGITDVSYTCEQVFEWTDSKFLANAAEWMLDRPIRIVFVLVAAWIISRILQRVVVRFVNTIAASPTDERFQALRERGPGRLLIEESERKRAEARAETIGLVLKSIVVAVVWSIAALLVLGQLEIDLAPLIAGAGIGGIALGFGAQSIVKDFLAGLFMLIEDQYGVGDIIDVGEATGTVEKVSLRSTTVRDVYGTVWHIPNGEISRVGNYSQLWSRALLDVEVAYDTDLELAQGVIQKVADDLWEDPAWGGDELMERPEVWGVQSLGSSAVAIRLVVKTEPSQQWAVERELRLRLKNALDAAGIEIPFPQQTVWFRHQGEHPIPPPPDPSTIPVADLAQAHDDEASV
ncbi:MAG: mechanosensitive ion channel family protein [Acidimicrobiales bacterium]|nr:mechanosensitive ion channel family protein [Acidimicrobiales bacterium]